MKNSFFKAALITALIAACALTFGGCFFNPLDGLYGGSLSYDNYFSGTDNRESVSEGYFKLTINTSKDEFAKGEAIDCWAQLEYIGDDDSITVYVYNQPVTMSMAGKDFNYDSSAVVYSAQKELTLKKGVPVRYTLSEVLPKSKSVLPGQYEIDVSANLFLSPDGMVSYYGSVSAVIVVKE